MCLMSQVHIQRACRRYLLASCLVIPCRLALSHPQTPPALITYSSYASSHAQFAQRASAEDALKDTKGCLNTADLMAIDPKRHCSDCTAMWTQMILVPDPVLQRLVFTTTLTASWCVGRPHSPQNHGAVRAAAHAIPAHQLAQAAARRLHRCARHAQGVPRALAPGGPSHPDEAGLLA